MDKRTSQGRTKKPETLAQCAKRLGAKRGSKAFSGQATCQQAGCDRGIWWSGKGKRPRTCDAHAKNPRRTQGRRKLVPVPLARSKRQEQRAWTKQAEKRTSLSANAFAVEYMALGLGRHMTPQQAAEAAGILIDGRKPTTDEIAELTKQARAEKYRPLRELRPNQISQDAMFVLATLIIRLKEQAHALSPASIPMAMRMLQQTIEGLGGSKLSYTNVHVDFGRPKGDAPSS